MATRQGAALDSVTHFILLPILTFTFGVAISAAMHSHHHRFGMWWLVVLAGGLVLLNTKQRIYALRVQDRVIRLEERLRIAALMPLVDTRALTTRQLIALRFASDAELPALVFRTLDENLDGKAIKASITDWRADLERI
jgi:hypothetical protein